MFIRLLSLGLDYATAYKEAKVLCLGLDDPPAPLSIRLSIALCNGFTEVRDSV